MPKIHDSMKMMLSLVMVVVTTMVFGTVSADTPFQISGTNVNVQTYDIDPEVNSMILQIQVDDPSGVLELTLERDFLDSVLPDGDDYFFVIIDGEQLHYVETNTSAQSRTIKANLPSGNHDVEVFGSHLLGQSVKDNVISHEIQEQNSQLQNENELLSEQVNDLSSELVDIKTENSILESKNEELGKTIFSPDNLITETEVQATNLITETEVQATNLITETEVQATNLITETEVQATNLITETEVQTDNITSEISKQITEFTVWFQSLF